MPVPDRFVELPDGRWALSRDYLLSRGYCCGNGCYNCPYSYEAVPEPRRTVLLQERNNEPDAGS